MEVDTKDCTALTESEFEEFADLVAEGEWAHDVSVFTEMAEHWVLVSQVHDAGKLRGFAYYTLERIGGTPSVVVGVIGVKPFAKRDSVLRALVTELLYKALLAFPDEDVLVGSQISRTGGYALFENLDGAVPRPGYEANGEDRAWGRRLAKRYGVAADGYSARAFTATGSGAIPLGVNHEPVAAKKLPSGLDEIFDELDGDRGDVILAHAWARAEDLLKLGGA